MRRALALALAVLMLGAASPAHATPGPSDAPEYWFDSWHVTQLWDGGARGQGITIAEIDTGVHADLPELAGNVVAGKDFGRPGDGRTDREVSEFGHGTAMASIMVAHPGLLGITGLAPDAKLLPIAVPLSGTTDAAPSDHLAEAIRWAADHGGKVISMSLGGARDPADDTTPCPAAEQSAVYYALRKGAVLLAAAGNKGRTTSAVEEPGVCLGVLSVGAVDRAGSAANFSSRHTYLTLAAPGVDVPSLSRVRGSAYSGKGTSQATAIATAVVALVWSKYPTLSGRQVVARVLATLDQHGTKRDPRIGFGIVNAYTAVTATVPADAVNPVYTEADPFLARDRALTQVAASKGPSPAAVSDGVLGRVSIGSAPRLVPRVLAGAGVAAAGLLALIGLIVVAGLRRRARRRRAATAQREQTQPQEPALHGGAPAGSFAEVAAVWPRAEPAARDAAGLVWHDITGAPAAPDSGPSAR